RLPSYRTSRVFLTVLVQGELSLYLYTHTRQNFYVDHVGETMELISHEYRVSNGASMYIVKDEANNYQYQLKQFSNWCVGLNTDKVQYTTKSLMKFVVKCNNESAPEKITYTKTLEKVKVS